MQAAAVFDIDGTLVTFKFDVQGTRKALLEELTTRGFATTGLGLTTPTQIILDSAESQISSGSVKSDRTELRCRVYEILDEFEMASAPSTSALPGTRAALDLLKAKSVRLAVLTNSGRKAAIDILSRGGLIDCFEFVLTRDDTSTMKPRPEGLTKAVSILGLPVGSVFYVGDSPYDIAAARGAGVRIVSVSTGNYDMDRLRKEGADFVISSISELPKVLGI